MTIDELKKKAGQAHEFTWNSTVVPLATALTAIEAEREACADIAFSMAHSDEDACEVSAAIRAR